MDVCQALDIINTVKQPQVKALSDLIPLELIEQAYQMTDTVTLRKRKLPQESLVWLLVGMALYNDKSISDVVNQLDIIDREGKPFVAPRRERSFPRTVKQRPQRYSRKKNAAHLK